MRRGPAVGSRNTERRLDQRGLGSIYFVGGFLAPSWSLSGRFFVVSPRRVFWPLTYQAETYQAETYQAETYQAETYQAETYQAENLQQELFHCLHCQVTKANDLAGLAGKAGHDAVLDRVVPPSCFRTMSSVVNDHLSSQGHQTCLIQPYLPILPSKALTSAVVSR
ncbi:hypothetical protein EV126DRAFT_27978 [Verticillium dahliae]|nr:hypothetical protein EV126DRAFT_27978 [Verticillium dahliae]